MFALAKKLRQAGVLGLNERNADYISRLNPRRLYPLVDDKALTKEIAMAAGMAVPELYGVISNQHDSEAFADFVGERDSFVIKPAQGSGGDGILVITGRSKRRRDSFWLSSGVLISAEEISHHISNIVSGQYSLSGNPDKALIEYCVKFDPVFAAVSYQGVPDIRVIVYRGYPAMAMVRRPPAMAARLRRRWRGLLHTPSVILLCLCPKHSRVRLRQLGVALGGLEPGPSLLAYGGVSSVTGLLDPVE